MRGVNMKGFSNKILVLLPKEESVAGASYLYRTYLKVITERINEVFEKEFGMSAYYLRSNALDEYPVRGAKQIYDFCKSDATFLSRVAGITPMDDASYMEIKEEAKQKFRTERGMADTERFSIIDKRQRYIGNKIVKDFKVVIDFQKNNNKYYTVKPAKGDKMKIFVDFNTFTLNCYLGEMNIPAKTMLQKEYACLPMYKWEGFAL